jgi:hypothetical protein
MLSFDEFHDSSTATVGSGMQFAERQQQWLRYRYPELHEHQPHSTMNMKLLHLLPSDIYELFT